MYKKKTKQKLKRDEAAELIRLLKDIEACNCSKKLLIQLISIFMSVDVNLYLDLVDWLQPHYGDKSNSMLQCLLREIESPYSFYVAPNDGICLTCVSTSDTENDDRMHKFSEIFCLTSTDIPGRIIASVRVGDTVKLNTKVPSWWFVHELRPESDSILLRKAPIEIKSRLSVPLAKKGSSSTDYRVIRPLFLLGATIKRLCETIQASQKSFFEPTFTPPLNPSEVGSQFIEVIFQLPSPQAAQALQLMSKTVGRYRRECSLFGNRVDNEVDPIKQMQAQTQVRVWMARKQDLLRASRLLLHISPLCTVNRDQWLLVGRALRTISRGGTDLLSHFTRWTAEGDEMAKSSLGAFAAGLTPMTTFSCVSPAGTGTKGAADAGATGADSAGGRSAPRKGSNDRTRLLSAHQAWAAHILPGTEEAYQARAGTCTQAWECMRPVTNCDHPCLARARVYLRAHAHTQKKGVNTREHGALPRGRSSSSSSSSSGRDLSQIGLLGEGLRGDPLVRSVLDSAAALLEERALVFLSRSFDSKTSGPQKENLSEPLSVPTVSYEVKWDAPSSLTTVDTENFTIQDDDIRGAPGSDLGRFLGSDDVKAYITVGDVIDLGSAVKTLVQAAGSGGGVRGGGESYGQGEVGDDHDHVEEDDVDYESPRLYDESTSASGSGSVRVLAIDLLYARLRVARCPAVPLCWQPHRTSRPFWLPVSSLWGVSVSRLQPPSSTGSTTFPAYSSSTPLPCCYWMFVTPLASTSAALAILSSLVEEYPVSFSRGHLDTISGDDKAAVAPAASTSSAASSGFSTHSHINSQKSKKSTTEANICPLARLERSSSANRAKRTPSTPAAAAQSVKRSMSAGAVRRSLSGQLLTKEQLVHQRVTGSICGPAVEDANERERLKCLQATVLEIFSDAAVVAWGLDLNNSKQKLLSLLETTSAMRRSTHVADSRVAQQSSVDRYRRPRGSTPGAAAERRKRGKSNERRGSSPLHGGFPAGEFMVVVEMQVPLAAVVGTVHKQDPVLPSGNGGDRGNCSDDNDDDDDDHGYRGRAATGGHHNRGRQLNRPKTEGTHMPNNSKQIRGKNGAKTRHSRSWSPPYAPASTHPFLSGRGSILSRQHVDHNDHGHKSDDNDDGCNNGAAAVLSKEAKLPKSAVGSRFEWREIYRGDGVACQLSALLPLTRYGLRLRLTWRPRMVQYSQDGLTDSDHDSGRDIGGNDYQVDANNERHMHAPVNLTVSYDRDEITVEKANLFLTTLSRAPPHPPRVCGLWEAGEVKGSARVKLLLRNPSASEAVEDDRLRASSGHRNSSSHSSTGAQSTEWLPHSRNTGQSEPTAIPPMGLPSGCVYVVEASMGAHSATHAILSASKRGSASLVDPTYSLHTRIDTSSINGPGLRSDTANSALYDSQPTRNDITSTGNALGGWSVIAQGRGPYLRVVGPWEGRSLLLRYRVLNQAGHAGPASPVVQCKIPPALSGKDSDIKMAEFVASYRPTTSHF